MRNAILLRDCLDVLLTALSVITSIGLALSVFMGFIATWDCQLASCFPARAFAREALMIFALVTFSSMLLAVKLDRIAQAR